MALTEQQIEETKAAMVRHGNNKAAIGRELGIGRDAVRNRLERLRAASSPDMGNVQFQQSGYGNGPSVEPKVVPFPKPKYRGIPWGWQGKSAEVVPFPAKPQTSGKRTSILHWCDNHHKPGADLENVRLIARHARENLHRFDMIRHGGDMCDYDSVSQHDPLGSVQVKNKPSLAQDIEAHEECLAVFNQELGPCDVEKVADIGNHEWRVFKYEQLRGELEGSLWLQVKQLYARYGWRSNDFGVLDKVDGVTFTHIPLSANGGRPYGSPQTIVRDLTSDLVACHTHKGGHWPAPKIGGDVTYYNGACSLPHGVVKDYCKLNPTGWHWGVNEIIITDGKITDFSFVSMLELQRRYA